MDEKKARVRNPFKNEGSRKAFEVGRKHGKYEYGLLIESQSYGWWQAYRRGVHVGQQEIRDKHRV